MAYIEQSLINNEIEEIMSKIVTLNNIRAKLEQDLLKLQEDELELDDERKSTPLLLSQRFNLEIVQGVRERIDFEQSNGKVSAEQTAHLPPTTRRRKGMSHGIQRSCITYQWPGLAFLPSEHEELPPGVAFMVCLAQFL